MTVSVESHEDELFEAARQALRDCRGPDALNALGWWELLPELGDEKVRAAAFSLLRAEGRELAGTAALGGLVAQPYVEAAGAVPGSIVATFTRRSARRGRVGVAVGDVAGMQLLVDLPGSGAWLVDPDEVELRKVEVPGRLALHELGLPPRSRRRFLGESDAGKARARSLFLARVALAHEMLGAAEGALVSAIEHAEARQQFGEPIARFQAVRHLLAWAATDCAALLSVAQEAVTLDASAPPRFDQVVKALAGRNGRRACERSLQVLGAIGFTAEHRHHHFHSRVLALDALLGASTSSTRELGTWLRSTRTDPGFAAGVLLSGPPR